MILKSASVGFGMVWYGMVWMGSKMHMVRTPYVTLALRYVYAYVCHASWWFCRPRNPGYHFTTSLGFTKKSQKGNSNVTADLSGSSL